MLVEGRVDFPAFDAIDGVVDLIEIDWQLAAGQISRDLLNLGRSPSNGPITFEAQWHPQRPLGGGREQLIQSVDSVKKNGFSDRKE